MYKVMIALMTLSSVCAECAFQGSLAKKPDDGNAKHERKKSTLTKEDTERLAKTLGSATVFNFEHLATQTDDEKQQAEKLGANGNPFEAVAKKGSLTVRSHKPKVSTPNTSPVSKKG